MTAVLGDSIKRVLVLGGGFAGSAVAIALGRAGVEVDIVEINPSWTTLGAGISIGGPSLRTLQQLGVLDEFLREGAAFDGVEIRTPTGQVVMEIPTPRIVGTEVPGGAAVMRPVLGRILSEAAVRAGATVRLGTTLTSFTDTGDGVDVLLSDGEEGRYDLLVAADGLYSQTREKLIPDAPRPSYNGQGAWRAVLPRQPEVSHTLLWNNDDIKVGINPVSQSQMYLFVNENRATNDYIAPESQLDRLLAMLAPFSDPVIVQVRADLNEDSLIVYRPIESLLVPKPWHVGRTAFIGDAVHATTPHLAAGAGIGLEDALVLVEELAAAETVEEALEAYQDRRYPRCRMVVENSGRLGVIEVEHGDKAEHSRIMAESMAALAQPI